MRARILGAVVAGAVGAAVASAQPQPPGDLPPLAHPAPAAPAPLPGVVVSQALQAPPPPLPPLPNVPRQGGAFSDAVYDPSKVDQGLEVARPAGPSFYGSAEYLIWYPKGQPLPILAARNDLNYDPALNNPGTQVVLDSTNVRTTNVPGGRFTLGGTLTGRLGVEANYLFLGTQQKTYSTLNEPSGPMTSLGTPYIDATTGNESVNTFRNPTGSFISRTGDIKADTSTRVTGFEALATLPLFEVPRFRMTGLAGYRYFRLNESLAVDSVEPVSIIFRGPLDTVVQHDEVAATSTFHGATVGTRSRLDLRRVYVELDSKISLGGVRETVTRAGGGQIFIPTQTQPVFGFPNGNFVTPTNAGRYSQTKTAWLPETGLRLGYDFGPARLFFGYNVIYLSESARPADQLDRTIDFNTTNANGSPRVSATGRPSPAVVSNEFWVQGVSFGVQGKY